MPNKSPVFFVPNEAYVFVRHQNGDNIAQAVKDAPFFKQLQDQAKLEIAGSATVAFSPKDDKARNRSLVKLTFFGLPNGFEGSAQLLKLILDANKSIRDSKSESSSVEIVGISPNWIAEASPDPSPNGGGGPGRHHVEASQTDYQQYGTFSLPPGVSGTGKGITVYVLDSFPSSPEKANVNARFSPMAPLSQNVANDLNNPPISTLCLHPYFARQNTCDPQPPDPMPSHGLFAANIISKIAPQATINPIQVLNDKAIGTMISLANGLLTVYQAQESSSAAPFIVNMSLAYPNPRVIAGMFWKVLDDARWGQLLGKPKPKLNNTQRKKILEDGQKGPYQPLNEEDDGQLKSFADDIQELINCSTELTQAAQDFGLTNGTFIASAGNDRTLTKLDTDFPDQLPMPDYPAIDSRVIGVGALDNQQQITQYTNMADFANGGYPGIWTFGGDYDDTPANNPTGHGGIIGEAEPDHYVWWAGTSFAAPIVSGVQACLLSLGGNQPLAGVCVPFTVNDPTAGTVQVGVKLVVSQP